MKTYIKRTLVCISLVSGISASAIAETVTWDTINSNADDNIDNGNPMTFRSDTTGYGPVDLTGFRIDKSGSNAGEVQHRAADGSRDAYAQVWDKGVGVNGRGDGSHTIDASGYYDAVLLDFGAAGDISLDTICMWTGWAGNTDTDFSLYAYAGSGTFDLNNLTHSGSNFDASTDVLPSFDANDWSLNDWAEIAAVDWELDANIRPANQVIAATGNGVEAHMISDLNQQGFASRYWIVAAIDDSSPFSNYKLEFVRGGPGAPPIPPTEIPVPATWLLLAPLMAFYRKRQVA